MNEINDTWQFLLILGVVGIAVLCGLRYLAKRIDKWINDNFA